jgi:hypothetical protein
VRRLGTGGQQFSRSDEHADTDLSRYRAALRGQRHAVHD